MSTVRRPSLKPFEFQRALGTRPVARTAHFVLHQLPSPPPESERSKAADSKPAAELSTGAVSPCVSFVDDSRIDAGQAARLGLVLPKKVARRSVTRSLLRHQAREALRRHAPAAAAAGWGPYSDQDAWVLRLRAPFDRQQFPSAASEALKREVRQELDELWRLLCMRSPLVRKPEGQAEVRARGG